MLLNVYGILLFVQYAGCSWCQNLASTLGILAVWGKDLHEKWSEVNYLPGKKKYGAGVSKISQFFQWECQETPSS